jgi:hypothetical protein
LCLGGGQGEYPMMFARPKPAMVLPLAFAALLTAPAASASSPVEMPEAPAAQPAADAEKIFVQLKIVNGKKTLKHPGHKMETGEELVLVLTEGKKKHEAVVYVESTDDGYSIEVTYSAGGKQRLKGTQSAKADGWVTFKSEDGKSSVMVKLKAGGKRGDGIDVGGGNNPLDGL